MKTNETKKGLPEDGFFAKLIPSAKPCQFSAMGEFPKGTRCLGSVTTEGNRMALCVGHKLDATAESLKTIERDALDLADRARFRAVRSAALIAMLRAEVR